MQLGLLLLQTVRLQRGEVVDRRELDERGRHEGEAHGDEPVHGGGVGHLGQRLAGADAQRCHGEDGGDAWRFQGGSGDQHMYTWIETQRCVHVLFCK